MLANSLLTVENRTPTSELHQASDHQEDRSTHPEHSDGNRNIKGPLEAKGDLGVGGTLDTYQRVAPRSIGSEDSRPSPHLEELRNNEYRHSDRDRLSGIDNRLTVVGNDTGADHQPISTHSPERVHDSHTSVDNRFRHKPS